MIEIIYKCFISYMGHRYNRYYCCYVSKTSSGMINCSSLKTVQTILLTRLLYYTHTVLGQTQVLGNQQELLLFSPVTRRTIRITATKIMGRCYKPGIWHIDCLAVTCSSYHSCVATNKIILYSCTVSTNNTVQVILTSRRGTPCFYYSALVYYPTSFITQF